MSFLLLNKLNKIIQKKSI